MRERGQCKRERVCEKKNEQKKREILLIHVYMSIVFSL